MNAIRAFCRLVRSSLAALRGSREHVPDSVLSFEAPDSMSNRSHFIEQAGLCRRLSEGCIDPLIAHRFHLLAQDYERKALLAGEPKQAPTMWPHAIEPGKGQQN